jgi:hypothetical protein
MGPLRDRATRVPDDLRPRGDRPPFDPTVPRGHRVAARHPGAAPALGLPGARGIGIHPVGQLLGPRLDRVLGVPPLPLGGGLKRAASHTPIHPRAEDLAGHRVRGLERRLSAAGIVNLTAPLCTAPAWHGILVPGTLLLG